jgi:hypothetical protein
VALNIALAGDVALDDQVERLILLGGSQSVTLQRGTAVSLEPDWVRWAGTSREDRAAVARTATASSRLLAKMSQQIRGVNVPDGPPESGRFVLSTPVDPDRLVDVMRSEGVDGGVPVGLAEYPGGIVVTVTATHDRASLDAFVHALTGAVDEGRRIVSRSR